MTTRSAAVCFLLLVLGLSLPGQAASKIRHGEFAATIGGDGVLVGVPPGGLRTVDGPIVRLAEDFVEWQGIAFTTGSGRVEGVGIGRQPDWANRLRVETVSVSGLADAATVETRLGDLGIVTEFSFDPLGPYLLARVTLTNHGPETLRDIIYTREWRQTADGGWTFPADLGLSPAPAGICRRAWMTDDLAPGDARSLAFSYRQSASAAPGPLDIPLSLWTDAAFPSGLPIGATYGISWGDWDVDGDVDLFALMSATLWRNIEGTTWELAADLDSILPPADFRYGSAFGDYDNDGLPDIGTEPRKDYDLDGDDTLFHLLKNLGGGPNFLDVAGDPAIVDLQPFGDTETLCWGDVNCDGYLDLFVPAYPAWNAGPGNFFLFNLGPSGPGGAYSFTEMSAAAGLDNPTGTSRPEGTQFVDVDFDGDMDLYSNGTLYQNVSTYATPSFDALTEATSGIGRRTALDEGAMFFDYDLDGDYDLFAVYDGHGVYLWESYGDGTFFEAQTGIVDCPLIGLGLGMSGEDWDGDGDIDFTTRQVFRRNRLIEDGTRHFTVATHSIPAAHLTSAIPAWADWDKDGDLDCALGNWGDVGHFYENTTYTPSTPDADRRYLRVRPVGNSATVTGGLENQFATSVEIHLLNGAGDGYRRKKFVASGHGYVNQNDYTLHFGLPPDPVPGDPDTDLRFDLTLDFPSLPADGTWRVDRHVNPILGDIDLADLTDREIKVYRCGQVVIDDVVHEPAPLASPLLTTTAGGLALPTSTTALPAPTPAGSPDTFVGLSFNTFQATDSLRVKEIVLDGELSDSPVVCGPDTFTVALWDVTDALSPFLVDGAALDERTSDRNRRSYFRTDAVLAPGRSYRLLARVKSHRATPVAFPIDHGPLEVTGGVLYQDAAPCSGAAVVGAVDDPTAVYLAMRFGPDGVALEAEDPIGPTLELGKDSGATVLEWLDLPSAAGYEIVRCNATSGPCTLAEHAATTENDFSEVDPTSDTFWYRVRAAGDCAAPTGP